MSERLQKFLSRAGVASRRAAETLITQRRVQVNNQIVTEMGTKVTAGVDLVTVDGKLAELPETQSYVVLYKPPGVVTTMSDPQGRETIRDLLRALPQRLFPIGRLDYDAEGALLLTDDGELANRLMHPRFGVERTYLAKVKGVPQSEALERLRGGVHLEDGKAQPRSVELFRPAERNTWLKIVVMEGRPHLIKRLCAAIGHPVVRLFRPAHAGVSVAGMQPGEWRALSPSEVEALRQVAAGKAIGETALHLPARRHGRGGDTAEDKDSSGRDGEERVARPHPPRSDKKGRPPRRPAKRRADGARRR